MKDTPMSNDEFYAFCMANPSVHLERTAQGEIILVPPAGGESDFRSLRSGSQLDHWALRNRQGIAFGSSVSFLLPNGAALSPDAAWVSNERLSKLSKEQRRKFLPVCPEFVIEVMSPSDRLPAAKRKMTEWMENGALLGWLIDADHGTAYVYRSGQKQPEVLTRVPRLRARVL